MVKFGDQPTVTTAPSDILKEELLAIREEYIRRMQEYEEKEHRGSAPSDNQYRAALSALFRMVRAAMLKDNRGDTERLQQEVYDADSKEQADKAFFEIDEWLYKKNLIKFDTKRFIPQDDIEGQNEEREE